jgi:hypothetical protein
MKIAVLIGLKIFHTHIFMKNKTISSRDGQYLGLLLATVRRRLLTGPKALGLFLSTLLQAWSVLNLRLRLRRPLCRQRTDVALVDSCMQHWDMVLVVLEQLTLPRLACAQLG